MYISMNLNNAHLDACTTLLFVLLYLLSETGQENSAVSFGMFSDRRSTDEYVNRLLHVREDSDCRGVGSEEIELRIRFLLSMPMFQ